MLTLTTSTTARIVGRNAAVAKTSMLRTAAMSATSARRNQHTLPDLPYGYDALEPSISQEIMKLHHTKHHQTYVNGLNAAIESLGKLQSGDASPETAKQIIALQPALKFNGGGHINHSLFWRNLAPTGSEETKVKAGGKLESQIQQDFGGLEGLKKEMNAKTAAVQGSGWGWLGFNKSTKKLEVVTTANQDPLLTHVPIIGIDIWEHAFYLQYKNVKPDYLNAIWDVINFHEAEKRLEAAL